MKKLLLKVSVLLLCKAGIAKENPLNDLAERLDKLYSSYEQSLNEYDYFDVTLDHCRVNITNLPESERNSIFFILEQAITANRNTPYRVRLIKLEYDESSKFILSKNYEPANQSELYGSCLSEQTFSLDYTNFLEPKCTIYLQKIGNEYRGGTPPQGCESNFRGASIFRSEVTIGESYISSWDRGFDRFGNQVWGARRGPYIFKEVN